MIVVKAMTTSSRNHSFGWLCSVDFDPQVSL